MAVGGQRAAPGREAGTTVRTARQPRGASIQLSNRALLALGTGRSMTPLAPDLKQSAAEEPATAASVGRAAIENGAPLSPLPPRLHVAVHDDAAADRTAGMLGARAVTVGPHVFFRRGQYAPHTIGGRALIAHELAHVAHQGKTNRFVPQRDASDALYVQFTDADAAALSDDELHAQLALLRAHLASEPGDEGALQNLTVLARAQAMRGESNQVSKAPEASGEPAPVRAAKALGPAAAMTPKPNWIYRGLTPLDLKDLSERNELIPAHKLKGATPSVEEMTFRQVRRGGNKPQLGSNRISAGFDLLGMKHNLDHVRLQQLARIDVDLARRLGTEFIENKEIVRHVARVEHELRETIREGRQLGRGKGYISQYERRLDDLLYGKEMVRRLREVHALESVPGQAVSRVRGGSVATKIAGERAVRGGLTLLRVGGRVTVVGGAGYSVYRVIDAKPGERLRVAAEEGRDWALSAGGAWAGAKLGGMLGTSVGLATGPGAVVVGAVGALVGGAIGLVGGGWLIDKMTGSDVYLLRDSMRHYEEEILRDASPEQILRFYEMRREATGEPPPWE